MCIGDFLTDQEVESGRMQVRQNDTRMTNRDWNGFRSHGSNRNQGFENRSRNDQNDHGFENRSRNDQNDHGFDNHGNRNNFLNRGSSNNWTQGDRRNRGNLNCLRG
ncbi:hypothetical protein TNCV_3871771 [Trichonephila clavipes]|nr:hypothetical protein TNCV_3871771 [Trichonephila clavipes]